VIEAEIIKSESGNVVGFTVKNHGEGKVCAAVSLLTINTANSIETFAEDDLACEYDEENLGYLAFSLTAPDFRSIEAGVLLDAMVLGLEYIVKNHPDELAIKYVIRK
jgi:uncharacterized protein YsxB (DUF464 family)